MNDETLCLKSHNNNYEIFDYNVAILSMTCEAIIRDLTSMCWGNIIAHSLFNTCHVRQGKEMVGKVWVGGEGERFQIF